MSLTDSHAKPAPRRTLRFAFAGALLALPALVLVALSLRYGWTDLVQTIYAEQRAWLQSLAQNLAGIAQDHSRTAAIGLIVGSAFYGFIHAVGPGHGKVIMTTYLLTSPERKSRALWLSVAAAFCQGLVAITIVYGLIFLLGTTAKSARAAALWSEKLSYILVAAMGAWLVWRVVRKALNDRTTNAHAHSHRHDHDHGHHHGHSHDHHHDHGHSHAQHAHHNHDHQHSETCGCGHAHAPSAAQVEAASDWRTSLGVVASIGFRPCTGAVLVLVLAHTMGIAWAGMASVLVMSAGTAAAVCLLALMAVWARESSFKLSGGASQAWTTVTNTIAVLGGLTLIVLGLTLLSGSGTTGSAFGI
ncbi:MAG: delayed-early response protein/equilibrative nucleoside transporter [Pseudomonadota bacterium]